MKEKTNPFRKMLDGWGRSKWVKRQFIGANGRTCLAQRMDNCTQLIVNGYYTSNTPEAVLLAKTINELFPERTPYDLSDIDKYPAFARSEIIGFNDHISTRWVDVEQVVEKAAVRWDESR